MKTVEAQVSEGSNPSPSATPAQRLLAARLTQVIEGRGASRRFRAVLERHPAQFTRWHRFDADARLGHTRSWLADHGSQARPARRSALP